MGWTLLHRLGREEQELAAVRREIPAERVFKRAKVLLLEQVPDSHGSGKANVFPCPSRRSDHGGVAVEQENGPPFDL